jgi:hypothetical protein
MTTAPGNTQSTHTLRLLSDAQSMKKGLDAVDKELSKVVKALDRQQAASAKMTKETVTTQRQLDRLTKQYVPLVAATKKYEDSLVALDRSLAANVITQQQYQAALEQVNAEYDTAKADDLARSLDDQAQAAQLTTAELDDLRAQFDPLYAATRRYKQQVEELAHAQRLGALTADQHDAALERLNAQHAANTRALKTSGGVVQRNAGLYQQAGVQLGDFLVQVGGGQNALLAFGQQANQLTSFMRGPWGIALTVATGLVAAFGSQILLSRDYVEEFQNAASDMDGVVSEYEALAAAIAESTGALRENLKAQRDLQRLELDAAMDRLVESFGGLSEVGDVFADAIEIDAFEQQVQQLSDSLGISGRGARQLVDEVEALEAATTDAEWAAAAQQLTDAMRDTPGLLRDTESEVFSVYRSLLKATESLLKFSEIDPSTGLKSTVLTAEQLADLTAKVSAEAANWTPELQSARDAQDRYRDEMIATFKASADLTEELGEGAKEALRLADVDLTSGISEAAKEAAKLAAALQISLSEAVSIMNLQSTLEYSGRGSGTEWRGQDDYTNRLGYKTVEELIAELTGSSSSDDGGGGGGGSTGEDELAKLIKRLELEKQILETTGLRRVALEKLGQDASKYTDQQIQELIDLQIEVDELTTKYQEQQDIVDVLAGAAGNAFSDMITGSKSVEDALKGMARTVINQLWDILVLQRLIGSWSPTTGAGSGLAGWLGGILYNAKGNVIDNGNVVPFASGGVVTAPTLFPMSGGKTGLMGEAGPEAIMPLSRGADGKLGVGASPVNVTVENNSGHPASILEDEEGVRVIIGRAVQGAQTEFTRSMNSGQGPYARGLEGGYRSRRKAT